MHGDERSLVPAALEFLDPAPLTYQEWLAVGMALHAEGYPLDMWERWSQRDPARFHPGDCANKWQTFGLYDNVHVFGGTIVQMARDRGFVAPMYAGDDVAYKWGEPIITDPSWAGEEAVPEPDRWDPIGEIVDYLTALFSNDDIVGYVLKSFERDGRWLPGDRGCYTMTAGEIVENLEKKRRSGMGADEAIERVLGTPNKTAGAWIRVNPLTGEGIKNSDVADYRYALVESDSLPIEQQKALIDELQLPCAAIVNSGGKSLHAIVRVEAKDYSQYQDRVMRLYSICDANGLEVEQKPVATHATAGVRPRGQTPVFGVRSVWTAVVGCVA